MGMSFYLVTPCVHTPRLKREPHNDLVEGWGDIGGMWGDEKRTSPHHSRGATAKTMQPPRLPRRAIDRGLHPALACKISGLLLFLSLLY